MPVSKLVQLATAESVISGLPGEAFRMAVDQADLAISITDPKANILFANEAFVRVTGYSREEIVGKNESTLSNKTTPPEVYAELWESLRANHSWSGKLLNRRKSGELYLAEITISPIVDQGSGKVTHYVGMHRDVTDIHRLERMVGNQKQLIESVVDAAPMALALLDQNGRVVLDSRPCKSLEMQINRRFSQEIHPAKSLRN